MLVTQNSNSFKKQTPSETINQSTPLLLKPTGVPVFQPIECSKTNYRENLDGASTDSGNDENNKQRIVQAQSIVIGKKIQNSTAINLIDFENTAQTVEKQFPVKVIYVKPTHSYQPNKSRTASNEKHKQDKENDSLKSNQEKVFTVKKEFLKQNAISDQKKISEQKHRPKSATQQQLNKNQVLRSKLGANSDIKPQISYVQKVVKSQSRPQTAKLKIKEKVQKQEEIVISPKKETEIPFAQNRFQGQFKNLTKDLVKKAQEALFNEKQQAQKQKDEINQKKEKQKQIAEEIKKKNQEEVQKQKEKGSHRIDFRKIEEEKKEKQRNEENNLERQKVRETREKRKQEREKQLGLDMFSEEKVEEYRNKVKQELQAKDTTQISIKMARPQSQENQPALLQKQFPQQRQLSAFNNRNIKDLIQEQKKIDKEEEEKKERDKKQILKEMKQKRKQQQLEQKKQEQGQEQRKLENLRQLEEKMRQQKEEYMKRKELQAKIKEEQERLQKLQDMMDEENKVKKSKKNKKQKTNNNHKEQLDELRTWIEEQLQQEDLREQDEQEEDQLEISQPSQIVIKIDKKEQEHKKEQQQEQEKTEKEQEKININQMKLLKHQLPGNHILIEKEESKLGVRQNRYGLYGDNGYQQVVEIQKDKIEQPQKEKQQKQEKEQLTEEENKRVQKYLKQKMKEFSQKNNMQIVDAKEEKENQDVEEYDLEPVKEQSRIIVQQRKIINNNEQKHPQSKEIPGILNIEKELKRQQQEHQQIQTKAVIVLQKWTRGFLARHEITKRREQKRQEIEDEYGYFEDQVKFNSDYNLKKFLKDKERLRQLTQSKNIVENSDIQEKIGESSSQSKVQFSNVLVQNFFNQKPDKDPLSIINIYAKRHIPQDASNMKTSQKKKLQQKMNDEEIEEEIYSENFDEEQNSKKTDQEIEEEIQISHSTSSIKNQKKKEIFIYKQQNSIQESIQDEILLSIDKRSRKSLNDQSSILEESHLQSKISNSYKKQSSIIEESMSYEKDEFESISASKSMNKKQIADFQQKIKEDESKRKNLVNEFLNELQRYESAHVSTTVVERMEKIINKSLAQKDKLLFGQRLHELELEKQHKDEINKIREEQIKLMSQLILMGNNGSNNNMNKEEMLQNIQRIIEKPIIIEKAKSESTNKYIYEEKEEIDYIAESKTLANLNHIQDSQSIEEEIPDEAPSQSIESEQEEIKESVYMDGKKQIENGLSIARMTLGSEEAIRQQAKKTLNGKNKDQNSMSNGTFEKSSFQDFTHEQFKKAMIDPRAINDYVDHVELALEDKQEKAKLQLQKDLHKQLISPRTFKNRSTELEKWVSKEKRELQKQKQKMVQTCKEMDDFIKKLDFDKRKMIEKLGSPRQGKRLLQESSNSQASLDYYDIEEESNDSLRVKEVRKQLRQITKNIDQEDLEEKDLMKKKVIAKKLLQEKEIAIQEGIKSKMKQIELEYVDELLNEALNIDIDKEIERRIKGVQNKNKFEESKELESARSIEQETKKKKKVNFASPPDRFSSVNSYTDSIISSKQKSSTQKFEESIGESIKIEESYTISSQQLPSKSGQSNEIKESVPEESSGYSEDFVAQSQDSKMSSKMMESKNKLQQKVETIEEQNDIGYSMNFDEEESLGQNQLPSANKQEKVQLQEVNEEDNEEDEQQQQVVVQSIKDSIKESFNYIDEEFESASSALASAKATVQHIESQSLQEEKEESEDKEVLQSSNTVDWQINLEQIESERFKQQSSNEEEKYSEFFEEEPESSKQDQQEQDDLDNLNDLQSCPDESESEFEELYKKADKITDELLELVMREFKEDNQFNINIEKVNEGEFLDKFPYTLDKPAESQMEDVKEDTSPKFLIQEPPKVEIIKKIQTPEEQQKKKYEQEQQQIKESIQNVENYLEFLVVHINRYDLIQQLEKPIEVDPLKVLSRIQALDNDASQSFNNLNESQAQPQAILSFELFMEVENEFKKELYEVDLTESQSLKYLQNENFHHKAIFDALNDALDIERPYKQKGMPTPWSKQTRVVKPHITQQQVEKIINKARSKVLLWAKTGAGTRFAPLPPPPPPQNEFEQNNQVPVQSEDERRNALREERLGELLTKEIEENEANWIDYEMEDAQVKFDLADMILEHLADEITDFLIHKQY